jgi:hypothetical protein
MRKEVPTYDISYSVTQAAEAMGERTPEATACVSQPLERPKTVQSCLWTIDVVPAARVCAESDSSRHLA